MKHSAPENIMLAVSFLLTLMILMLFVAPAVYATGKDNDNSVNVDNEVTVGGSSVTVEGTSVSTGGVSTGGNKSLAIGNVLGDVDIAQCLGSTQWSTPVYGKQKLSLNWVCVAEFYIKYQQPELAAMALCNTDILKEFSTEEECEQAHQFLAQVAVIETAAGAEVVDTDDEDEMRYEEAMMVQQELAMKVDQLQELVERSSARPTGKSDIEKRLAAARKIMQEAKK